MQIDKRDVIFFNVLICLKQAIQSVVTDRCFNGLNWMYLFTPIFTRDLCHSSIDALYQGFPKEA